MNLKNIEREDFKGKKVFLRVDLDVPIKSGKILDDLRLKAWFPTLEFLLKNGAEVVLAGHLGRPKKQFPISNFQFSKENEKFSLKPIAQWVNNQLELHSDLDEVEVNRFKAFKTKGSVIILENLRFYKEEEEDDEEFSKQLALFADIYVNDAFASSHRAHASIVGITKFLPSFAGIRLLEEVKVLSQILENPKKPMCVILGGAKIETKLPLVEKMHQFADYVLVGGEIAENTKVLLKVAHEKISAEQHTKSALLIADLTSNQKDITQKSAQNFLQIAQKCETIVWNGPMGMVEEEKSKSGTLDLATGLSKILGYKIVGGGDTLSFLKENNLLKHYDFVSIGGGAMLELLAGEELPGLVVLEK